MHKLPPFLSLLALTRPRGSDAFSSPTSSTAPLPEPLQRIATMRAELLVSVGRVPGTVMPPEWAASGARLGFALEVEFADEPATCEMSEELRMGGDGPMVDALLAVEPLNQPTFVSSEGTQRIRVESGAYGCETRGSEFEDGPRALPLRFLLDFPDGATRNDVELPPGRVHFLASCWLSPEDDGALERARERRARLTREIDLADARANKIRSQKSAENPLGNLVQRAFNFRHLVVLAERREGLRRQLVEVERTHPLDSTQVMQGPNDVTYAKEGVIAVKRSKGAMGTRDEYCWVGSFAINRFL